jgi:hypothetical protein
MARHLQDEVTPRPVHPVKNKEMRTALYALQRRSIARVDLDGAYRMGFTWVFRALLRLRPGGADPADIVDAGVELVRQFDRRFALADS